MRPPLGALRYLYVGSADFAKDHAYYRDVLGAEEVWHFAAFGANVAAFRVGDGPLVLLADHRHAPSCLPVYQVPDLDATVRALESRGWRAAGEPFGIPDGTCVRFDDPSGNEWAFFEEERPGAMEGSYADRRNPRAVRHE
jgi:predicted enzyme related to lactoylglutathione lyase